MISREFDTLKCPYLACEGEITKEQAKTLGTNFTLLDIKQTSETKNS